MRSLNTLRPGEQGSVEMLRLPPETVRSLGRLGLTEGTQISCQRLCPFGGPGLYRVRGAVLALRRKTAGNIWVRTDV